MSSVDSNCVSEAQNSCPCNVRTRTIHPIDVKRKCCTICEGYTEFTDKSLERHFKSKHPNVAVKYDFVNSMLFVECSSCRVKIRRKRFEKHKNKAHACRCTVNDNGKAVNGHKSLENDVLQNQEQNTGQSYEDPYAIDLPNYFCKLCNVGPLPENLIRKHFTRKHNNIPPDFEVKPGKRVKCSSCGAKLCKKKFDKHKTKVHLKGYQLNSKNSEDFDRPDANDMMVIKCNICGKECLNEKILKKHFAKKHKGIPIEFIVEKSDKFVRCSACKNHITKARFTGHSHRRAQGPALVNIGSVKVLQLTNLQLCQKGQEAEISKFNHPLANEKFEKDKYVLQVYREHKNAHTEAPMLFGCRICEEKNILEQNKMKHHLEHHRTNLNQPFQLNALTDDFYLLDSGTKNKLVKLRCTICHMQFNKNHFQRHMRRAHSKSIAISAKKEPLTGNQSENLPTETLPVDISQQLMAFKVYKCFACDAHDILEPNLVKHHVKRHFEIPIEINIFEATGRVLRERCGICQKFFPEGRVDEHKKRSHTKRLVEIGPTNPIADIRGCSEAKDFNRTRIQHTEPVSTELHKCVKCKAVVSKDNIQVHRKNHKVSKSEKLFQLIGTKNVIKCTACLKFIEPETFTEHIKQHRSLIFVSVDGKPLLHPEPAIRQKVTQKPFFTHPNSEHLPKYRKIYKCRICKITKKKDIFIGDTSLDGIEIQKHPRKHRNDSIDGNIFRLITVKVKCNMCDLYMKEKWVEGHMKKVHSWNYDLNFTQLYKCGCCDAHGISKRNLVEHHARMHNIPIDRNKFKVHALKQKIVCDCCGKRYMEGRPNKHKLKSCLQRANAVNMALEGRMVYRDEKLAGEDC
ncbi:uncharacterized protein LOC119081408 [Bradysia coprophila]|uniref:uncharacterized protein LOC119081408 n=1 Tax=Bradysia coprophila TaxID=38358 RepID=UPI00187DB8C9|nr:uncharacterized protein LOC119081408 [Bradysia coprophila]